MNKIKRIFGAAVMVMLSIFNKAPPKGEKKMSMENNIQKSANTAIHRAIAFAIEGKEEITEPGIDDLQTKFYATALALIQSSRKKIDLSIKNKNDWWEMIYFHSEYEEIVKKFHLSIDEQKAIRIAFEYGWKQARYDTNELDLGEIFLDPFLDNEIPWVISNMIPRNGIIDVFGGPEAGKSTLIMSLLVNLAFGMDYWFFSGNTEKGLKGWKNEIGLCKSLICGGEKDTLEAWKKTIIRIVNSILNDDLQSWSNKSIAEHLSNIKIINSCTDSGKIENKYILKWNSKKDEWEKTKGFSNLIEIILKFEPKIIVLDTVSSCFQGYDPLKFAQHQKLLKILSKISKDYNLTIFTISHTNQASHYETLQKRLYWISRSGNTSIPGELRCLLGFSALHPLEIKALNLDQKKKYVAFAVSKASDYSNKEWNIFSPAVFELDNKISLISRIDSFDLEEKVKSLSKKRSKNKENNKKHNDEAVNTTDKLNNQDNSVVEPLINEGWTIDDDF